jgi:hypothetical protein
MATVERVQELLEKLRVASWDHHVQGTIYYLVFLLLI